MRIITELIGGIVLLTIFAYGVKYIINYLNQGKHNGDEHGSGPDAAAGNEPV